MSDVSGIVRTYFAFIEEHRDAALLLHSALPLPLIESLVLGPVIGVARRWLSGIGDVDLEEAVRVLPDRIWRSVSAEPT